MKYFSLLLALTFLFNLSKAQPDRWQQRVKYTMDIDMDVVKNKFSGKQKIEYWNNSPDTLKKVFYHLFWNAFQPGSMMDLGSRYSSQIIIRKDPYGNDVSDFDRRFRDFIYKLI